MRRAWPQRCSLPATGGPHDPAGAGCAHCRARVRWGVHPADRATAWGVATDSQARPAEGGAMTPGERVAALEKRVARLEAAHRSMVELPGEVIRQLGEVSSATFDDDLEDDD